MLQRQIYDLRWSQRDHGWSRFRWVYHPLLALMATTGLSPLWSQVFWMASSSLGSIHSSSLTARTPYHSAGDVGSHRSSGLTTLKPFCFQIRVWSLAFLNVYHVGLCSVSGTEDGCLLEFLLCLLYGFIILLPLNFVAQGSSFYRGCPWNVVQTISRRLDWPLLWILDAPSGQEKAFAEPPFWILQILVAVKASSSPSSCHFWFQRCPCCLERAAPPTSNSSHAQTPIPSTIHWDAACWAIPSHPWPLVVILQLDISEVSPGSTYSCSSYSTRPFHSSPVLSSSPSTAYKPCSDSTDSSLSSSSRWESNVSSGCSSWPRTAVCFCLWSAGSWYARIVGTPPFRLSGRQLEKRLNAELFSVFSFSLFFAGFCLCR